MFARACALGLQFTRPIVVSSRNVDGKCSSSIAAYILVNADGWILTAGHVVALIAQQREQALAYRKYWEDVHEQERDLTSGRPHRAKGVRKFQRPGKGSTRNHSVWLGVDGTQLVDVRTLPNNDLAVGRLDPFDASMAGAMPVFKSPGPDYMPGRSLCRLGFPFHDITPSFNEESDAFTLPQGSVPVPMFPLDTMFARKVRSPPPDGSSKELGTYIETTTPGLRGQSGGPLLDVHGAIWGVQSHTKHYALGFAPRVSAPGERGPGQPEHQFFNSGLAVDAEAITRLLDEAGIAYQRTT